MHTDLDASESGPDAVLHAGALRTEKIAKFLEAHFGEVEVVETREVEIGEATTNDEEDTLMGESDETDPTEKEKQEGDRKLLVFEPAIVVNLDDWEARVGLLDLVRILTVFYMFSSDVDRSFSVRSFVATMNRSSNELKLCWKWP